LTDYIFGLKFFTSFSLLYLAWNEQYQDTTFMLEIVIIVITELFVATYYLGMETVLNC